MNEPQTNQTRKATRRETAKHMKRARTVQLSMLPKAPVVEGLDIHAHYQPCEAVGGDFYDFVEVSPWELGIVMGDVSGHGVDAALTMAVAKKAIQLHGRGRSSPRETLLVTCSDLAPDLPGNSFITVFYGVLDLRSWKLTFASAGHMPPVVFNPDRTPQLQSIASKGVVMGAMFARAMETVLAEQTVSLRKGDTLFLYTDGLTETSNPQSDLYGEPRLLRALDMSGDADARTLIGNVIEDVKGFASSQEAQDDLTMLAVRIVGSPKPAARLPENKRRRSWPTNLRLPTTAFVGRTEELAQLREKLAHDRAVACITGAPGLGKSRLALEAGRAILELLPGGVWHVDVSANRGQDELASAVAQTLGLLLSDKEPPAQTVGNALQFRPPILLILDNCEGAEKNVGPLVSAWIEAAPQCRFLVTGREPLEIADALEIALSPLGMPQPSATGAQAAQSDSVALFFERAKAAGAKLDDNPEYAHHVADIVRELEGNPLAIELAAAQSQQISVGAVTDIQNKTPPPKKQSRRHSDSHPIAPPHAADWSFNTLKPFEQSAFCQLSIMRGGFFLEAAEDVVRVSNFDDAADTVAIVQSLVDKSLLQAQDTPYGVRFSMLPPIRSFGRRKRLETLDSDDEDALTRRFANYFAIYATRQHARTLSRHAVESLDRLEIDLENILAAQDLALAMGDGETAAQVILGLDHLLHLRGPERERIARTERALAALKKDSLEARVRLLTSLGESAFVTGDWEKALRSLKEAEELSQGPSLKRWRVKCLCSKAYVLTARGNYAEARSALTEADNLIKDVPVAAEHGLIRGHSAWLAYQQRDIELAQKEHDRAEAIARELNDLVSLADVLTSKAIYLRAVHRLDEALALALEAEQLLRKLGSRQVPVQIGNIGVIYRSMERLDEALDCFLQCEAALREEGNIFSLVRTLYSISDLHLFLQDVDSARKCALEAMQYAVRLGDKVGQSRAHLALGHADYSSSKFADAAKHFNAAWAIELELNHDMEAAVCEAMVALCKAELGEPSDFTQDDKGKLFLGSPMKGVTPRFLVLATKARLWLAKGERANARKFYEQARAVAEGAGLDHYNSDRLLQVAWQVMDAMRESGLGDSIDAANITVRCEHCRGKVRGSKRKLDDLISCPVCKTAPFRYEVFKA